VSFDEPNVVANAGLLLVGTLAVRLELERLVSATVRLSGRVGGARPGRKVLTLVHAIVAGASHIDHAGVLAPEAPSGCCPSGSWRRPRWARSCARSPSDHVRQLEAVVGATLRRAWAMGAGPGPGRLVIDVDSSICEVEGHHKQGAAFGDTKVLGYHPILATRAATGEVLHARMHKGSANTARGTRRFIDELVARVRRAGASGEIVMRFDSGFWSNDTITRLGRHDVRYTMAVRTSTNAVAAAIAAIAEDAWADIDYTPDGKAQVAACEYKGRRLVVRRTRLTDSRQAKLWPDWRHFAFLTDLTGTAVDVNAFHRRHAVVELAIRDLKEGAGMEHVPSGHFSANSAWLQCAVLGPQPHPLDCDDRRPEPSRARHRGPQRPHAPHRRARRLVNLAGTMTLRGPLDWPWAEWFRRRLACLRGLQLTTG